jgi:hypothetical protein
MKTLASEQDRAAILEWLARVTPASQAGWGRLSAQKMLCHVADHLRMACAELLRRYSELPAEGKGPTHPFFGALTWREWGVLQWRHADHHLRQFDAK